jgi:hypothetical protein
MQRRAEKLPSPHCTALHCFSLLQGQQRRIAELEQQLTAVVARLEEIEQARRAAEERTRQLSAELEGNASVFALHYEELLRRDREVQDLQAVISALSLGGGDDGGSSGGGEAGGAASSGKTGSSISCQGEGSSDGEDDGLR